MLHDLLNDQNYLYSYDFFSLKETITHKTYPLDKDNFIIRWFPPEKTTANIYFV